MLGLKARWILLGATVAASGLTLQPASAVDIADVKKVCEEFLLEHLGDSDKEKACIAAMEQHAAENPPPDVSDEELAPVVNRVVPENQIQSASRPDSTDRDKIAGILRTGASADVLVEFEVRDVDIAAFSRAFDAGVDSLRAEDLAYKREEYARVKASAMGNLRGVSVKRDYDNLPTAFVQIADEQALNDLMSRPDVRTVHENKERQLHLAQSLPIIGQPAAAAAGRGGAGTTVAVLDSGVTYSRAEFNSCTSPGVPAACRVKATLEATATNDGALDDDPVKHGTNVSAIIAALAGDANLVVADVISVNGLGQRVALDADVATGLNWAIANKATFNIVAVNLSLGDTSVNTTTCPADGLAPSFASVLAAGIQPVVSAGNTAFFNGVFDDGVASPACVPAAVRVGAVYDANLGGLAWGAAPFQCTDTTTAVDKVTCFSQSAPILSLLAPGAVITAGGQSLGGTSQAAPHVAGAWAVYRAAAPPGATTILQVMQASGDGVVDTRPNPDRTTSRLNLVPEPAMAELLATGLIGVVGLGLRRKR